MENKRIGHSTVAFPSMPRIVAGGTVVGDVEAQGPLGTYFDIALQEDTWQEDTWEKAERKMFAHAVYSALDKAHLEPSDIDILLGGDLLNQIISANYAARELQMPFLGLYGACSTMAESMLIAAMLTDGGFARRAACAASSHFSTAERQYRLPLEMGSQSVPTSQRTVTGAGCTLVCANDVQVEGAFSSIYIKEGIIGRVTDLGITDAANMGAAMAPAAADTLIRHLNDTDRTAEYYDLIITGDLGKFGSELFNMLLRDEGIDAATRHLDCGNIIFSASQNAVCGGSGCGCSAVTLNGYILPRMEAGEYNRILFMATGALMSPTAGMQGESIPSIAHGVVLERS